MSSLADTIMSPTNARAARYAREALACRLFKAMEQETCPGFDGRWSCVPARNRAVFYKGVDALLQHPELLIEALQLKVTVRGGGGGAKGSDVTS